MSHSILIPAQQDPSPPSVSTTCNGDQVQNSLKRRIAFLLNLPENKYCVDCCRPAPRWVSLVVVDPHIIDNDEGNLRLRERKGSFFKRTLSNISATSRRCSALTEPILPLGCFCCLECSGAHRRLGTHVTFVRSVDLDSFKELEVQALEFAGNATVNGILEANLLRTTQDCETGAIRVSFRVHDREIIKRCGGNTAWNSNTSEDRLSREAFIKDKYDKKLFIDYNALRRIYLYPTYTKSGAGCIVYPVPESPQASTASDTESACEASVPSANSDLQLKMFTSSPKTIETINKYIQDHPVSPSKGSMKKSSKTKSKQMPPRHKNSSHQTSSSNNISDDLILDLRNMEVDTKSHEALSPQSSLSLSPQTQSPSAHKDRNERNSTKPSDSYNQGKGNDDKFHAQNYSPLLDNSMIVSIDYEETSAYEVVYQRDDEIDMGREDVLNNYGRIRGTQDQDLKGKRRTHSLPPKKVEGKKQESRSNSRSRSRNDDSSVASARAKDENFQKLGRSSSKMRNRKENEVDATDQTGSRFSLSFSLFKSSKYDSL